MTTPRRGDDDGAAAVFDDADVDGWFRALPDPSARDAIVARFLPFAEYLARRFAGRGESIEDLTQVATIGLLQAIDRFDVSREVRFSTYAAATIVGELKRHFRDKGWAIRVPRRLQETATALHRSLPELSQQLGRSPTIPELARYMGRSLDEITDAMEGGRLYSIDSLDVPLAEGGATTVADTIGEDDPSVELVEDWVALAPAVADLSERDRRVLYLRFFRDMTQSEIARDVGVSQMHVSRILQRVLESLREVVEPDPQSEDA